MTMTIETTSSSARSHLKAWVEKRRDRRPTQAAEDIRRATLFIPGVRQLITLMLKDPARYARQLTHEEVMLLAGKLKEVCDIYEEKLLPFVDADVNVARRGRAGIQFGPAVRALAAAGAEVLVAVRTAVGDAVDGEDPLGRAVREGCGVGVTLRMESPVEVLRALRLVLAVLEDDANAGVLQGTMLPLEQLVRQANAACNALDAELKAGNGETATLARARRDEAQLWLEGAASTVLSLIAAGLGKAKRDEIRAFWPSTRAAAKKDAETPVVEEGTPTGVTAAVVPVGGTPLVREVGGGAASTAVAGQPLFGSSGPAPMVHAPVGGGAVGGGGMNGGASTGMLAAAVGNKVNGTSSSNGVSHG